MEELINILIRILYGILFIIVGLSPIIAPLAYLASLFAWRNELKRKSIFCLITAIVFSLLLAWMIYADQLYLFFWGIMIFAGLD